MMRLSISSAAFASLLLIGSAQGLCPALNGNGGATASLPQGHPEVSYDHRRLNINRREGDYGVPEGGYEAVMEDLKVVLTTNNEEWPSDWDPPHYGGLMIRLAWHCSGSYRESDGRGGCDGGRIRFDPELNWMDNGNLDKALMLLEPIKEKYGPSLSWGDLVILAGNAAIESMGGPIFGFCGGRVDDPDGSNSRFLGPNEAQEDLAPCRSIDLDGRCPEPLGPTTLGLIYVNPEGPVGETGNLTASADDVRLAFNRMGFDDRESVALIGGGHAFGKCHGACPDPPCGNGTLQGKGPFTVTSGLEGQWTTAPTTWTNQYFNNMFDFNWTSHIGPGGALQWETESVPEIMMLTTDLAFTVDDAYEALAREYAANITSLEYDFMRAWYRLTTADMGPRERCMGSLVPDAQWWQHPLPEAPATLPDYGSAQAAIQAMIDEDATVIAALSHLAFRCADTFRETDYRGGCNGARIRFEPESIWPINAGTGQTLEMLETVKDANPDVSWSDLIVLAGQTAIEAAGGNSMTFCGGRTDASDGTASVGLEPRDYYTSSVIKVRDDMLIKGLTQEEGVALWAHPHGSRTELSNQYFIDLQANPSNFSPEEQALLEEDFVGIVDEFVADNVYFLEVFARAWNNLMIADRYDGPVNNVCRSSDDGENEDPEDTDGAMSMSSVVARFVVLMVLSALML